MIPARLPSNIVPCKPAHLVYLAGLMREDEKHQFMAVTGMAEFSEEAATYWLLDTARASLGHCFTALDANHLPAAAGGFQPTIPGVWQAWMVGTPEGWRDQWRSITRGSRWVMDRLLETGIHRLQACSLTCRPHAIEWFERSLGFKPCGTWHNYAAGYDLAHFERLRED